MVWTGTAWVNQDLTAAAGSPVAVSSGSGLVSFVDGSRVNIAYIDSNQHLSQLLWTGAQWVNQDLTAASGAPSASPGSAITSFLLSDGPHLVYVDVNEHLDQVFYSYSASQWYYNDLTWSAGAPIASSASGLTSILLPDGPHIAYVDWNQHVDQVFYSFSQDAWYYNDLTATTYTASASPGTALSSFTFGGDPHFVFVDANQHVEQIFYAFSANQWYYNDLTSETNSPPASGLAPSVNFQNLTHPNLTPNFAVGDTFQITIHGAPNQPVNLTQTANGSTGTSYLGNTDAYGNFTMTGVEQTENIGTYTQVWSVGGVQAGSAASFVVGQFGDGTLISTELATDSTGQILGVSSISIANGLAISYSATEFDYQTSLYYDAGTVATMYEEGAVVRSASASGGAAAGGNLSYPAAMWKDYTVITDHYATAYIVNGGLYYNPYYFQSGSCDNYSSDCAFVPSGGYLYVSTALIYLGSTATEHTNVALDASDVPLVDNDAYTDFMNRVPKPTKDQLDGFKFSVATILKDYRLAALLAASAYKHSQDQQVRDYQVPMFLKVIRDEISEPAPFILRSRRYKVLDIFSNPWRAVNPLKIDEHFTYIAGDLPLPQPNSVGWEIDSPNGDYNRLNHSGGAVLFDDYQVRKLFASDTAEIDFWQMYSASNFIAPGTTFPNLSSLGIANGGVPLILILPASPTSTVNDGLTSCAEFAIQSIRMSKQFVQFNGDTGPHGVCAY